MASIPSDSDRWFEMARVGRKEDAVVLGNAAKALRRIEDERDIYREAYEAERAYHSNNTGENSARRKKAVEAVKGLVPGRRARTT